ncbi:hypothetical protein N7G274_009234 [Stereocaulon virgatum]|uniref:NAD(P)-binding protein n=1 Tax=Stereocaulon virgatum TaxID=373712 RepID=A0ABR3ZZP5_9LECA
MPTILVVGASSGIGKAFVCLYLRGPDNKVIATDLAFGIGDRISIEDAYRKDVCSNAKGELSSVLSFDISHEVESQRFAELVPVLDIIVHSAGVRGLQPNIPITCSSDVARAETWSVTSVETIQRTFHVNAVGTFLLLKALIPKLTPASHAKVIIMGSRMGSINHNTSGGAYAYRASKAALNAIVKSFAIDVPEIVFVVMHPGRVASGLVSVKEDGAISAEESVNDMGRLIDGLGRDDSGRFMDRFGIDIPW